VFACLLNSGAAVGHLMTADVARFDPHDPVAMSADPAALPPAMREYHAWLLSTVSDLAVDLQARGLRNAPATAWTRGV